MKIGVSCYPTYGGSGAVATELGLELANRGHEIHFISYAQPFRLDGYRERVFFHQVEVEDYPLFEHPPYTLALAVALHDAARQYDLDLVHVHYAIPHAASAWIAHEMLAEERDLRVVTTLHGTDITLVGQHPSFQAITRFSLLRSHGLTAVSEYLRRETVKNFDVSESSIHVVPNFIDTVRYRREGKPCHRATLAPEGERIIMHVSNFRPVKRAVDIVDVFHGIAETVPARLVMVGDGPERSRAAKRVEELGLGRQVIFLGKLAAVDELLACADLFLLPSASESFGLAALEAMACGTPVIASRVGGLPEVVEDGETGFLLPVGDVDGMAAAGVRALEDPELWSSLSEKGRSRAVDRFSVERVVPLYEELYREVLEDAVAEGVGGRR